MSRRLLATIAIPLLGLLFLLGGLAYLTGQVAAVEYRGRAYEETGTVPSTRAYVPTPDRIGNRQVFVPERPGSGPPPAILLQSADGTLTAYRRADE
jgi:hypothetical protein